MKTKFRAAAAAAVAVLAFVAYVDDTNIVGQVARKAIEIIGKAVGLTN